MESLSDQTSTIFLQTQVLDDLSLKKVELLQEEE